MLNIKKSSILNSLLKCVLCVFCISTLNINNIFATEVNAKSVNAAAINVSADNYALINNILSNIKEQRKQITEKIASVQKTDSYINYPAVRLNVDTPIFGISAIISNELKISYEVTSSDVSGGYSVDSVIKSNKIKIPSYTVASFVVKTREININDQMTQADANIVIFKLIGYLNQVKSVNERLDKQLNNILLGYNSKEKSTIVSTASTNVSDIESISSDISDMLNKIGLLNVENLDEYSNKNNEIEIVSDSNKKSLSNQLTTNDAINKIIQSQVQEKEQIKTIDTQVKAIYTDKTTSIDKEALLKSIFEKIKIQNDYITKYIANSDGTFQENRDFCYDYEINNLSSLSQNSYSITSKKISTSMQSNRDDAEKQLTEYLKKKTEEQKNVSSTTNNSNGNNVNNVSDQSIQKTEDQLKAEQKENLTLLDTLNKTYLEFLNNELEFIKDNMDMLIEDSKTKLTIIGQNTTEDISKYVQYVFIDYSKNINKSVNYKSIISKISSIESLKKELNTVLENNLQIKKIYNEKILKSTDMNRDNNLKNK